MIEIPSPAISVVGRHNSGKTTLVTKLIREMSTRGFDVGSVKHHSHGDFDIDYPGKDSYRHREAGATETVIASPVKAARIKTLSNELECSDIIHSMPGHDIVIVEGYRKSGLPTIEIMRADNNSDVEVAREFASRAHAGETLKDALCIDDVQMQRTSANATSNIDEKVARDITEKMPNSSTVAVVTDIADAESAAKIYGIPCFNPDDICAICDFLEKHYTRQRITVVIQAGGESKRMGRSKSLVEFQGRPLISRMVSRMLPAADELIITTNEAERLSFLYDEYPDCGLQLVSDEFDFRGALPGLYTALLSASNEFVAVVACDMLFASPKLVVAESIEMGESCCDIVVPVNQHGFEPFHAMYRRSVCLEAVLRAINSGQTRVQAIFDDVSVNVTEFPQKRVLEVEPSGGCFINANTPEELHALDNEYLIN